ncbi:MAG TPA: hypothetical protein VG013_34085 [Gemmataceae bacterium]|nr:hypothetical protein [Gemmataceae bacterium]
MHLAVEQFGLARTYTVRLLDHVEQKDWSTARCLRSCPPCASWTWTPRS